MIGTFITAGIVGLGSVFFMWLRQRQAEQDRAKVGTQQAYIVEKMAAEKAEKEASDAANSARDNAVPDFTTLK